MLINWLIGALFTIGFTPEDDLGFFYFILIVICWPVLLGMVVRKHLDKGVKRGT